MAEIRSASALCQNAHCRGSEVTHLGNWIRKKRNEFFPRPPSLSFVQPKRAGIEDYIAVFCEPAHLVRTHPGPGSERIRWEKYIATFRAYGCQACQEARCGTFRKNTNKMGKIYCYVSPVSVPGYQEAPVRYVPEKHELRWEKYIATIGVPA